MNRNVLILLTVLMLIACKKDNPLVNPLAEYRLVEYTHNQYRITYSYDSQNRPEFSETLYDENPVYTTRFFYSDMRLDSLATGTSTGPMSYETFRFSGDTLLHTIYRYAFDEKITLRLLLSNNQVVRIIPPPCILGDSTYDCMYEVLNWHNNNLICKQVFTNSGFVYPYYKRLTDPGNAAGFQRTNTICSDYDNNPNPLTSLYKTIYPGEYESSVNNLLRMVVTDIEGDTLIRNFKHTYNEYGLPVSTTETQEKNNTPRNENVVLVSSSYTYTYEKYQ